MANEEWLKRTSQSHVEGHFASLLLSSVLIYVYSTDTLILFNIMAAIWVNDTTQKGRWCYLCGFGFFTFFGDPLLNWICTVRRGVEVQWIWKTYIFLTAFDVCIVGWLWQWQWLARQPTPRRWRGSPPCWSSPCRWEDQNLKVRETSHYSHSHYIHTEKSAGLSSSTNSASAFEHCFHTHKSFLLLPCPFNSYLLL